MNRSKLLIGIFIAFILIVITIVLLACTVFVVREVTIEKEVASSLIDEEHIIETSGLTIGRSIISISKDKVKADIEKDNPEIEVLNITRSFPNKVTVKVTLRTGILLITSSTGENKVLVDASLKVLKVMSAKTTVSVNATEVKGATFDVPEVGAESLLGSNLTLNKPIYSDIFAEFSDFAKQFDLQGASFSTLFKEITFLDGENSTKALIRTNKGVTLVLDTALTSSIYEQLYARMIFYTTSQDVEIDRTSGYIAYDPSKNSIGWLESIE